MWGATENNRGANLPTANCPDWKYYGCISIDPNANLADDLDKIVTEVEEKGLWIGWGTVLKFSEWVKN